MVMGGGGSGSGQRGEKTVDLRDPVLYIVTEPLAQLNPPEMGV